MPQPEDRVAALVAAFLDFLEGSASRPTLDHLNDQERREAERLMALMEAGRGIDPTATPPLGEHPAAAVIEGQPQLPTLAARPSLVRVISELQALGRSDLVVTPDVAASSVPGARTDVVVRVAGLRLRVWVVESVSDLSRLQDPDLLRAADRIFYRFPETAAVALVTFDEDLFCLIVEPQDTREAVETPSGGVAPPRPRRPILPLRSAVAGFLDDVEPIWEEAGSFSGPLAQEVDVSLTARGAAEEAVRNLVRQGERAVIEEKKETWRALGAAEVEALARLTVEVNEGRLGEEGLAQRLEDLVGDAA